MSETIAGLKLPQSPPKVISEDKSILELFSLKGKVASITGGSAGIGFAVAEGYAQAGADLALWYNSTNPTEKAKALSEKYGITVKTYACKITDSKAVAAVVKQQVEDFGKIDIFVANAGIIWTKGALIDEDDDEEWLNVMDVDVNGVYYCAKYIGRVFKKQGFGSFIATASISGHIVNVPQKHAAYNAAKAAVIHLCRSLAVEWAGFARANSVSPGYIGTEMVTSRQDMIEKWNPLTPLGRPAEPVELVGAYLYLASDASTFTTGSDIIIDGGLGLC